MTNLNHSLSLPHFSFIFSHAQDNNQRYDCYNAQLMIYLNKIGFNDQHKTESSLACLMSA